jgi:uncharacterized protein YprB with RNaseH-like and TPR domain
MPSLSDKLKSLGVKVGAHDLEPPRQRNPYTVEAVLDGHPYNTQIGETFVVEALYPPEYLHGHSGLLINAPLNILAAWAGDPRISGLPPQSFAFIDTETTGLSGGTGTYAFLIGAGRFDGDEFHLAQFFMRDPIEEPAQLAALEEFLAPCNALVSYNGKAFDIPLLTTRFVAHGWRTPFNDIAHVDLLHLARRLWRDRLPSRTLGNIEAHILGTTRTGDDIPGWMIPQMYFDYLRSGDARPLKSVFYHNAMDVLSLAALLNHTSKILSDPLNEIVEHGIDIIALAKLFEDLNDLDSATRLYVHALDHIDAKEDRIPKELLLQAIQRLAMIHKRQENFENAIRLWEEAAGHGHIEAYIELAKYYEHRTREYPGAIFWTQAAIDLVNSKGFTAYERQHWLPELNHRLERLQRLSQQNDENIQEN